MVAHGIESSESVVLCPNQTLHHSGLAWVTVTLTGRIHHWEGEGVFNISN
jgi:hypothetical protein